MCLQVALDHDVVHVLQRSAWAAPNIAVSTYRCVIDFYGADRVLFGSDSPFDPEKGPG